MHLVKEDLEKQELVNKLMLLQEELTVLTGEHQKAKLMMQTDDQKSLADSTLEDTNHDTVVHLQKVNRALMESLEQSCLVSIKTLRIMENLKEQQVKLERCLGILQTETYLLQDEVKKLHRWNPSISVRV